MFCKNCGKEMRDDAKFCPNCGALASGLSDPGQQGWSETAQSALSSTPAGGKKRRGLGLMLGAGVAAVAVVALLVVGVSGLFSSPKSRVEKAVSKTLAAYEDIDKKLDMPDTARLSRDKSVSTRVSVELKGINSQLVGYDLSDLYGLGLRMSTNYSGKDQKMDAQMSAFWDDEELAAFQMLFEGANLYFGSPQFTGDTFFGLNTETLGTDLEELTGDDSVEDLSFNIFDLMEIAMSAQDTEEAEQALKAANKALTKEIEVKKTGAKTLDINGKSTKTTAYHVVIPQDALEDYVDALADAMSSVDYVDLYEEMFKAAGMSKDQINDIMSALDEVDMYGELADGLKYALDELGDIELDVYLSGGYVSAVVYEDRIQGSKVEIGLYLGGGEHYADNLSLEIKGGGGELLLESAGNHTGKGGTFTDETTVRIRDDGRSIGRLTSELSYEPNGKGSNFRWEIGVDSSGVSLGVLEMEGRLNASKDSLDLNLEDVSLRTMGMELLSLGVEYYVGPCKGMEVSVKSPMMLADMSEDDMMDLAYDIQSNAEDWLADMEDLFGSRLSEELLRQLMYGF